MSLYRDLVEQNSVFLKGKCPRVQFLGYMIFAFFVKQWSYFLDLLYYFTYPQPRGIEFYSFLPSSPALSVCINFYFSHSYGCIMAFHLGLICICQMANQRDHHFMCHLCTFFSEPCIHMCFPCSSVESFPRAKYFLIKFNLIIVGCAFGVTSLPFAWSYISKSFFCIFC